MKNTPGYYGCLVGLFLFLFLFIGCKSPLPYLQVVHQSQKIRVSQQYIPVLKGVDNQVLELGLELTRPNELKEIQVDIQGNEAIEGILIHQLIGEGDKEKKIPLAAMAELKVVNHITIDKKLPEGIHRFSISLIPKPEASLLEKINVDIPEITLGSKKYRPQATKGPFCPLD